MMAQIVYLRDSGDGEMELCAFNSEGAAAYVRADCAEAINISEKKDLFIRSNDRNESIVAPCNTCKHNSKDMSEYPCAACEHL